MNFKLIFNLIIKSVITFDNIQANYEGECGSIASNTEHTNFPWLAAIYALKNNSLYYQCGATLLSRNLVVTAAHCVLHHSVNPRRVFVYLGYETSSWGTNQSDAYQVDFITTHPMYVSSSRTDGDLAILVLANRAQLSDTIRPICLPELNTTLEEGIFINWGMQIENSTTFVLNRSSSLMRRESYESCLATDEIYQHLVKSSSFCTTIKPGTWTCKGDSGSGLYSQVSMDGKRRWFLMGVFARTILLPDHQNCLHDSHFVFTDVLKLLPWLKRELREAENDRRRRRSARTKLTTQ